ncbi:hypothetical protein [Chryseobacterium sp. JV274]|uniref:hypothetical protein n=1 Tax=Chryseobacterium sp. JV274 TaxID=1932669 RepID=UPI00098746AD|nr:hypothetical protein [Chryseobacterium sp. JV274]
MESNKAPLRYFEDLLEYNKVNELKDNFIKNGKEKFEGYIETIDSSKGIIIYLNSYHEDGAKGTSIASFESTLTNILRAEFQKSKSLIDDFVLNNSDKYLQYLYHQQKTLQYLINRGKSEIMVFPVLLNLILGVQRYINEKYLYNQEKKINVDLSNLDTDQLSAFLEFSNLETVDISNKKDYINPEDYSALSFSWDSLDHSQRIDQLTHLYSLLTANPPVIQCSQDEFINAFSQRKVIHGIKWLLKGKNGDVSKSTLFYFVDFLNRESYINTVPYSELNKRIEYIFRDNKGEVLKNLRQSKNTSKESVPFGYERLDSIFSQL